MNYAPDPCSCGAVADDRVPALRPPVTNVLLVGHVCSDAGGGRHLPASASERHPGQGHDARHQRGDVRLSLRCSTPIRSAAADYQFTSSRRRGCPPSASLPPGGGRDQPPPSFCSPPSSCPDPPASWDRSSGAGRNSPSLCSCSRRGCSGLPRPRSLPLLHLLEAMLSRWYLITDTGGTNRVYDGHQVHPLHAGGLAPHAGGIWPLTSCTGATGTYTFDCPCSPR